MEEGLGERMEDGGRMGRRKGGGEEEGVGGMEEGEREGRGNGGECRVCVKWVELEEGRGNRERVKARKRKWGIGRGEEGWRRERG